MGNLVNKHIDNEKNNSTPTPNSMNATKSNKYTKQITIEGFTSFKQFKLFEDFALFNETRENFTNMNSWIFKESSDWYKVVKNSYSINMIDTGIMLPTKKYSFTFMYKLEGISNVYNNIFRISNTQRNWGTNENPGAQCDGCRIPAMWVLPNTTNFDLRFSTDTNLNDGLKTSDYQIPTINVNDTVMIGITFNNDLFSMYYNGNEVISKSFNNIHQITPNATLYFGGPWDNNDGNVTIKDFIMHDGVLTSADIYNMYNTQIINATGSGTTITTLTTPTVTTPTVTAPTVTAPTVTAPTVTAPTVTAPTVTAPTVTAPTVTAPTVRNAYPQSQSGYNFKSFLKPDAVIDASINRILTNENSYAYCLGGKISCNNNGVLNKIDDYKYGSTYNYKCSNDTQAYCSNGILESNREINNFKFSNSYKGFTVETKDSPYVYDLGSKSIVFDNNSYVVSEDICNFLNKENRSKNCYSLFE